jgi:sulfite exporter TauE/SafE
VPARNRAARNRRALGLLLIVVALYVIIQQFGLLNMLIPSQLAATGMGYGLLFVIGVLTSVHCLAMCGGINLSQSITGVATAGATGAATAATTTATAVAATAVTAEGATRPSARSATQPSDPSNHNTPQSSSRNTPRPSLRSARAPLLYNLGRITSYTATGALVGALGTVIALTPTIQGVLKLVAGTLMIFMGLTMMGAFPSLHNLLPRPPKALAKRLDEQKEHSRSPLYVGLLNGLMPCGPLQAMQIYALSTGSALAGALAMFVFALGTVPLVFGLGVFAATLGKRFTRQVMTVGAVLVLVLGLAMFSQGFSLAGIPLPLPLASMEGGERDANGTVMAEGGLPPVENGIQIVDSALSSNKYPQITVQAGLPVRWTINADEDSINGCNYRFLIPEYGIEHSFEPGSNIIEFTPAAAGRYSYSCWMGMIRGTIVVVEAGRQ